MSVVFSRAMTGWSGDPSAASSPRSGASWPREICLVAEGIELFDQFFADDLVERWADDTAVKVIDIEV